MRKLVAIALAFLLASCATAQKLDAANDVHALLVAIRDNDQAAFDAHVDRPALKAEIQELVMQRASQDKRLAGVAAILAPSLVNMAGDALIQPSVFRAVAEHYGYSRDSKIPGTIEISQALKRLPDGRVCAISKKGGPCLIDFTRGPDGRWRLSGFEGDLSMLRLKV